MDIQENYSCYDGYNGSIACAVTECKFNEKNNKYCTLRKIQVVKHEALAKDSKCTDCGSFMKLQ